MGVFIGIGSNLQDPALQVQKAIIALRSLSYTKLLKSSSLYVSQPLGPGEQPPYINAVAEVETQLSPASLLAHLQELENQQGRVRKERWGPRTIDLDILLYGKEVLITEKLIIPHVALKEREFVIYPLSEIAEHLILPDGEALSDVKRRCPLRGLHIWHEGKALQ
jgi:2-amino-4-hydroxy-6-hydroxymethyldihydropteridine diphosphokinase